MSTSPLLNHVNQYSQVEIYDAHKLPATYGGSKQQISLKESKKVILLATCISLEQSSTFSGTKKLCLQWHILESKALCETKQKKKSYSTCVLIISLSAFFSLGHIRARNGKHNYKSHASKIIINNFSVAFASIQKL